MRSPRVPFAPHGTKTACSGGTSSFSPAIVASSSHSSSRGATLGAVDFHGSTLRAGEQSCQNGLTDWDYLPGQWRQANVAYPLFSRQGRVNDGGVGWGPGKAA